MGINFETLLPLLLLLPTVAALFYGYYLHKAKSSRMRLFLILRTIAILLMMLSLCGIEIVRYAKDTATIFVADLSSSTITERESMIDFISDAVASKSESDHVGIVAFGYDAQVEQKVDETLFLDAFESTINPHYTDIQSAMIQSMALFPGDMKRRMVLLTDGRENIGQVTKQIGSTIHNDVAIDFYAMDSTIYAETQIDAIDLPKQGERDQIIEITVKISSNVNQSGVLYLYSGENLKQEQNIDIEIGDNNYVFYDTVGQGGLLPYEVVLLPEKDTFKQNNQLSAFTMISDMPHILLIQDDEEQGQNLINILEDYAHIDVKSAKEVPQDMANLLPYDAFILADVSKPDLDDTFLENLNDMIINQGKGLVAVGGDNSYGLGGYKDTLLETMLPVEMDVKSKEEKPNLGLVLVIDKSGSMSSGQYGITKLELAKEAAIRATEILEEKDQLGVIAFDDTTKWVIETSLVDNRGAMQDQIATIVPGGGTTILPSLAAAVDDLAERDVALKHIILLTDGQAERMGYESTLAKMTTEGITLSTVAVGEGADRQLLNYLSMQGGGRYYETDVFTDIPSIFTKEAYMAGKKYLNNITFFPELYSSSVILSGIDALPELEGYVATSKKDNARTILVGPEEDPILATWQYGLGRTMAWTPDIDGLWTSQWLGWEGNRHFWINAMSWLIQEGMNADYSIETAYEEGIGKITVTSLEDTTTLSETFNGTLISPQGETVPINLEAVAPGVYEGDFVPEGEGVYMVNIPVSDDEFLATGVNVGYSPEFDILGHGMTTPEALASIASGRLLDNPTEVFKGEVPPIKGSNDISRWLLTFGLLLFIFEIVLRKTNLNFEWVTTLSEGIHTLREKVPTMPSVDKETSSGYTTTYQMANKEAMKEALKEEKKQKKARKRAEQLKKQPGKRQGQMAETSHIDALMKQKQKREK